MRRILTLALSLTTAPLLAQQPTAAPGPAVEAIRPNYDRLKQLYLRSAEAMPEVEYAFRPLPEVRTFGELLGHVANENFLFCAGAGGEKNPNTTDFEKVTSKAELLAVLRRSFEYCDPFYRMNDTRALEPIEFFRQKGTRLWVLIYNVTHDSEHYGNIVTYLRMRGITPPSSVGGM
jgi:uncharacterized damage-inducible protein DinB